MREQTLIIQGTIFLLVLMLFTSIIYPLTMKGIVIIRQSSYEALLRSNDARVSQTSYNMQKLISLAFLQANMTLNKVQQLYLQDNNPQYQLTNCFQTFHSTGYYTAYCSDKEEQINKTSEYFKKYSNFLNEMDSWILSIYLDQLLNLQLVFRIQSPHITSAFGLAQFPKNFNVEKRPYYIDHLAQNNTRYIGNPFINQISLKLSLFITQTIYDNQKNRDLIMAVGFQFDTLNKYLSLNNITFILCTLHGIMLASNLNNSLVVQTATQITHIQNQTILPFNENDWSELNNYIYNKTFQSNCKQSLVKLCRNLDGKDIQIEATIVQSKFIQIIFNDLSFTESEEIILQNNIQQLINYFTQQVSIIIPFSCGILIISTILLQQIIKPAAQMIQVIEQQIKQLFDYIGQVNNKVIKEDSIFGQLQISYKNFITRHIDARNLKIQLINNFRYPQVNQMEKFDNEAISSLYDNQYQQQFNDQINKNLLKSLEDWNN
ncbi:hypothetical protein pb186bvf_015282 [Paramecium bursaria]